MHPLSIDHITVLPAGPLELVDIAAETGCPLISPRMTAQYDGNTLFDLRTDPKLVTDLRKRCESRGIGVATMLTARFEPGVGFDAHRRIIDIAAELNARNVLVVSEETDRARQDEFFLRLCEEAGALKMGVALEHVSYYALSTLQQALDLVQLANARKPQPHIGLVTDVLHLYRSGGSVADLARLEPALFRHAQICDGPLVLDPMKRAHEAGLNRMVPGEGELPVREFLRALPDGATLAIEVPQQDLHKKGVAPLERAHRLVAATRALMQEVGRR
jgi:sugar phosphate isomerase/epimerase